MLFPAFGSPMMATRTIFSWACSLSLLDTFVEKNRGLKLAQIIKFLLNFNIVMVMQKSDAKNQGEDSDLCENGVALVTMSDFFLKKYVTSNQFFKYFR